MAMLGPAKTFYLASLGGWVRRTAQTLMRYRRGSSGVGQPPHAHADTKRGALLRKHIYSQVDPSTHTVVVGAEAWPHKSYLGFWGFGPGVAPEPERWNVPSVHEHGWSGTRKIRNRRWRWYRPGMPGPIRAKTVWADSPTGHDAVTAGVRAVWVKLTTPRMADRANSLREQLFGPQMLTRTVNYARRPFMSAAWVLAVNKKMPEKIARQAFGSRRAA